MLTMRRRVGNLASASWLILGVLDDKVFYVLVPDRTWRQLYFSFLAGESACRSRERSDRTEISFALLSHTTRSIFLSSKSDEQGPLSVPYVRLLIDGPCVVTPVLEYLLALDWIR